MDLNSQKDIDKLIKQINALLWTVGGILTVVIVMVLLIFVGDDMSNEDSQNSGNDRALIDSTAPVNHPSLDESSDLWVAADIANAPQGKKHSWSTEKS